MCLLKVMHRVIRHAMQVWYRLVAGIWVLSGFRPGLRSNFFRLSQTARVIPKQPAQQNLKHKGLDLHNERTFRHIVMHFCNFSAFAGRFRTMQGHRLDAPSCTPCIFVHPVHLIAGLYALARYPF